MRTKCLSWIAIGALAIVGCGGGGGGGTTNVALSMLKNQEAALESENIQAFSNTISVNYFDVCTGESKSDVVASAVIYFGEVKSTVITNLKITSLVINEQTGQGSVYFSFHLKIIANDNSLVETDVLAQTDLIRDADGVWRDWGASDCTLVIEREGEARRVGSFLEAISRMRQDR